MDLNDEQRAAVEFTGPHLLVVAAPGAGKTGILVHRVVKLIERGVRPDQLVLMTFTRKAAQEMRDRLEKLIGPDASRISAGTFHSFAFRLLKEQLNGAWKEFAVVEVPRRPIGKIVRELKLKLDPQDCASNIMLAQQRLLTPDVYREIVNGDLRRADIAKVYDAYQRWKWEQHKLDYGDFVPLALQLLEKPETLVLTRARCKHLLIDEFQDIGYDQFELMKRLVGANGHVTAVGDFDQSVYGFRGADPRFLDGFRQLYPRHHMITVTRNYRSTPEILRPALALIRHNTNRIDKPLMTRNQPGAPVEVTFCPDTDNEAKQVVQQIARDASGKWGDCAILYRCNAQSLAIESALFEAEIPYSTVGKPFFELSEVKLLLAYLRLARNPLDDAAVKAVLNIPPRYLGPEFQNALQTAATEGETRLYQALDVMPYPRHFQRQKAREFKQLIEGLRSMVRTRGPAQLMREIRGPGGFDAWLTAEADDQPDNERARNVDELCRVAERWNDTGQFLQHVMAVTKAAKGRGVRVNLLTMHRAKGLEWPHVCVIGACDGVVPHEKATWAPGGEEEERRLFYVGMTRAMNTLTISVPARMWRKQTQPSRFLYEAELLVA
jgi:superfamily I DNA/RNA helicase